MAFDYTEFVDLADELVVEYGRSIVLIRVPETPDDVNAPYNGPAAYDYTSPPADHQVTITAFFIGPEDYRNRPNEIIAVGTNGFIVAAKGLSVDLADFVGGSVEDGSELWSIEAVNPFKPGPTVLLYGIELTGG